MQYWPSLKGLRSDKDDAMSSTMDIETQYCAPDYRPLPVFITRDESAFVEVAGAEGLTRWAVARIRQVLDLAKLRRLAS